MAQKVSTLYVAQHERIGGQAANPILYWCDYHRSHEAVEEALADLPDIRSRNEGDKFFTGRVRVIMRVATITEFVTHDPEELA